MFLHNIDYSAHQRDFDMGVLTTSSTVKRDFAENAAVEQIKSYLRKRFDVDLIFINVRDWSNSVTYAIGDHVVKDGIMYNAILAGAGQDPALVPTYWQVGDLRDPFLVMTAVDMAVYHLYAKIPKRTTPEDVNLRYSDALEWLKGVSTGEFIPNFPLLSDDAANTHNEPKFGSDTKINHRW